MKTIGRLTGAVLAMSTVGAAGAARAADLAVKAPAPVAPVSTDGFDYAFGAKVMSDYISRGITQSNHSPSVTAYGELRYNLGDTQFYVGVQPWTVDLPTRPAAELDLYAGIRQTWGALTVDFGAIGYVYPDNKRQYFVDPSGLTFLTPFNVGNGPGIPSTARDPSYFEAYVKPSYTFNDFVTAGANLYYSPNWNNYGGSASETYVSGTLKLTGPGDWSAFSLSGEFGHEFLGTSSIKYGPTKFVDYNTWNVGLTYAWKNLSLDLRYYGTDLTKAACYINGSDPRGNRVGQIGTFRSNWCDDRFVATLSVDFSSKDFK